MSPPQGPDVPLTATGAAAPGVSAVPPTSEPAPAVVAYGVLAVRSTDSGVPASATTVLTVFAVALPPQAAAVPSTWAGTASGTPATVPEATLSWPLVVS